MMVATVRFVIRTGESLSDGICLGGDAPVEIIMPAAWTSADLTFQSSNDGVTYQDLYRAGEEVVVIVDAAQNVRLVPGDFIGINYIKLRSGTSETPINQDEARTIRVALLGRPR